MRVSIFTTSSDNASDFSARLRFWSMRTFSFSIDLIMVNLKGVAALLTHSTFQKGLLFPVKAYPHNIHQFLQNVMMIEKKIEQKAAAMST